MAFLAGLIPAIAGLAGGKKNKEVAASDTQPKDNKIDGSLPSSGATNGSSRKRFSLTEAAQLLSFAHTRTGDTTLTARQLRDKLNGGDIGLKKQLGFDFIG